MDALPPYLESLRAYPPWFVVACAAVAAAGGLWLLGKLLKWTVYALIAAVLLGGLLGVIWLLWR